MKLESLRNDLFVRVELDEAASVLGGMVAPVDGGGTFNDCYTFFTDGSYRTDDKDQDAAA